MVLSGCCPNMASGNASTRPPYPRSKTSQLGLCSRVQKPHSPLLPKPAPRMHDMLPLPHPTIRPLASLPEEPPPRICSLALFLSPLHPLSSSGCKLQASWLLMATEGGFVRVATALQFSMQTSAAESCLHPGERHKTSREAGKLCKQGFLHLTPGPY